MRYRLLVSGFSLAISVATAQDTVRVRADNAPVWGDRVRLVPEFTIGKLDGPPEYAFGRIGFVTSLSSGAFFVYDRKDTVLRRYDAKGRFLGRVGRSGAGPGEFREVLGVRPLGDSLIATWDPRLARVSIFSTSLQFRRSLHPPGAGGLFSADVFATDIAGRIAIRAVTIVPPSGGQKPVWTFRWKRYTPDGRVLDSILVPPFDDKPGFVLSTSDGDRRNFGTDQIHHLDVRGALMEGRPADYRLTLKTADGKPLVVQRSFRPIPISGDERAEWVAIIDQINAGGRSKDSRLTIPSAKPAFRDFQSDPLGRIWVEVYTVAEKRALPPTSSRSPLPPLTWRERSVFEVIDAAGRYLGRVELPAGHRLASIQKDRVWLISEGPDGEQLLSVYRLETATGAIPR